MSDLTLAVRLLLSGNVAEASRRFSGEIRRFSEESRAHVQRLSHDMERLNSRWTALASGAGLAVMAKKLMEFEHQMTMIGLNAQLDPAGTKEFKEQIVHAARAKDVKLAPQSIATSAGKVIADTGDMPFAEHNLRNMGLLMRATDATPEDAGGVMSFLQKYRIREEAQIKQLLDTWLIQGYTGAFTLGDMSRGLPIAGGAMAMGKNTDLAAMKDLGVFLQLIRMSTTSGAEAVVSAEQFMKLIGSTQKVDGTSKTKGLIDVGLNPYLPGADKPTPAVKDKRGRIITPEKPPTYQWRPLTDILMDAAKLAEEKPKEFKKIFADVEASRAVTFLQAEYQKTKGFPTAEALRKVEGKGNKLEEDAATAAKDMTAVVTGAQADAEHAADRFVLPPLKAGMEGYGELSSDAHDKIWGALYGGAASLMTGGGLAKLALNFPKLGLAAMGGVAAGPIAAAGSAGLGAYTATDIALEHLNLRDLRPIIEVGETVAQVGATLEQIGGLVGLDYRGNRDALAAQGIPQITSGEGGGVIMDNVGARLTQFTDSLTASLNAIGPDMAARQTQAAEGQTQAAGNQTQAAATMADAAATMRGAAATMQTAAAVMGAGIHGTITVKASEGAQVTSLTATGPVDLSAQTGKVMAQP